MSYKSAYKDNHAEFEISSIIYEDDASGETPNSIEFFYNAPNISVDVAGRFEVHEIIGSKTVRQKIGEEPIEVEVEGVCREPTARQLDGLRDAKYATIISNRLSGGTLRVQFASVTTSPLDDGGAVALKDSSGQFLYEFDISAVEVLTGTLGRETSSGSVGSSISGANIKR